MLNRKIFQILELLCMTVSKTYLLSRKISRKFALVPVHKKLYLLEDGSRGKGVSTPDRYMMGGEKQLIDPNFLLRNPPRTKYIHKTNKYNQMMKIIFIEILPTSVYFSGSKVKQR